MFCPFAQTGALRLQTLGPVSNSLLLTFIYLCIQDPMPMHSQIGWTFSSPKAPLRNPIDPCSWPPSPNLFDKLGSETLVHWLGIISHCHGALPWVVLVWSHIRMSCLARKGMSLTFTLKRLMSSLMLLDQCPPMTMQVVYQQVFTGLLYGPT
jgi:hypothetical protein